MRRNKIVYSFLILAVILVFAVGPKVASAIPISGTIGYGGSMTPVDATNTSLSNFTGATGFINFVNVDVETVFGDFVTEGFAAGDPASYSDFDFNPLFPSPATLWSITKGLVTASFELSSVSVDFQNAFAVVLSGNGTVNMTGFDPTPGTWSLTANAGGGQFTFSSITTTPEPGTVILLGIGLAGIVGVGVRRKMKMRKQTG